jgi:hypothetical protein
MSYDLEKPKNLDEYRPTTPTFDTSIFIDPEVLYQDAPK